MRLKYRGNYYSPDVNWFWLHFIPYQIDSTSAVAAYSMSAVSTVKIHRFYSSVTRKKMTWLYTFAFIELMCCNFINTLTLNRLSISPACCVYYYSRPCPSNIWIILILKIRAWLCRITQLLNAFSYIQHTYFLFTQARSFNLNTKVIYRAPILSEKHQRVKLILLLSLKARIKHIYQIFGGDVINTALIRFDLFPSLKISFLR